MTSQITSVSVVCSTVCSRTDQRKHQSSAWLAFVRRIHRSPADSPHKGPVARETFPFDDVIMHLNRATIMSQVHVCQNTSIQYCILSIFVQMVYNAGQVIWVHCADLNAFKRLKKHAGGYSINNHKGVAPDWLDSIDGLAQDCGISSALAMEISLSCANPSIFTLMSTIWILWGIACRLTLFKARDRLGTRLSLVNNFSCLVTAANGRLIIFIDVHLSHGQLY